MRSGGRAVSLAALAVAAVLGTTLAACGGDDDDAPRADDDVSVIEDDAAALEAQQANAPRCADLFALGVVLPAQMPDFCKDPTDAMRAVVFYECGDDRRLYQVGVGQIDPRVL